MSNSMTRGARPLNEARLIVLGYGGSGKTSVVRRLVQAEFRGDESTTQGINTTNWLLQGSSDEFRLNIWDFSGQEIMHATYQFFLAERSLYLLVLNGREGGEAFDAEYWLKHVESFGGDSPVIIVQNKIGLHPFDLNYRGLQGRYPQIRAFVKTDCKDGTGIDELRTAIREAVEEMPETRIEFPADWFAVKQRLEAAKDEYISYESFRRLCAEEGIEEESDRETLRWVLHCLGIALNYSDDSRLRETSILKPEWVTQGIYSLLNAKAIAERQGELHLDDLRHLLPTRRYPADKHLFLLELMRKFSLCFAFPDEEKRYLIPELLGKEEPVEAAAFPPGECLNFEYHYGVLPEGLMPRFIVRSHTLSRGHARWRLGVILAHEDCKALVTSVPADRRVIVRVKGGDAGSRRRLLALVRYEFDRINAEFKDRLDSQPKVPLPEFPEYSVDYKKLVAFEKKGVESFPEFIGDRVVIVHIAELLNGVDLEKQRSVSLETFTQAKAVFFSYSHKDEWLRDELETHLKLLQRQGVVSTWHDRKILPGSDWGGEIDSRLERAEIILLLVSADFLASDYCWDREVKRAVERHEAGEATVIPILLRACDWKGTPFEKIQGLPKDMTPVTASKDRDAVWAAVAKEISLAAKNVSSRPRLRPEPLHSKAQADVAESNARELLAGLDYRSASAVITTALTADPERSERLKDEFGFIMNLDDDDARREAEPGGLRWRTWVWRILSERNNFDPPPLSERPATPDIQAAARPDEGESNVKVREQAGSSPEQRGEMLEQAVVRLFQGFFQLSDRKDEILECLRQQRRGTQFGYDIGFDCVLGWNNKIRCHVECKNLTKEVTLKEISDKLHSQNHFDRHIDIWILISPRADISNELHEVLEGWKRDPLYPFDIQVWSPSTGIGEFFGLVPEVYEAFYETGNGGAAPREWDEGKRAEVRERWRRKLKPPLRLPEGWERYLREPFRLCLRREDAAALDATHAGHVTMMCRHAGGAPMPLPLEHYVCEWLERSDKPVFFLLGEFGDGKSFFTYSLARRLASEFRESPETGWVPLRLALRDFFEMGNVRDFLRRRLEEFGATLEGWTTLRATRRLLVILDGFDEMSKQLDPATITRNINALIECYEEFEGCKVLITSRTHFFERRQEERRLMSRLDEPLVYNLAHITRRTTERNIEMTAERMGIPLVMTRLRSLHDPIGLAAKPLFLQMLKDMLHDLPDDLDEVTLYEKYVRNSLKRKADQLDDRELKTDREELLRKLTSLLEAIAVKLQTSEQEYISLSKFSQERREGFAELLWKMTGPDDEEDARARVGVRSLLTRVDTPNMEDDWPVDFCHRSIREYFVARNLCSTVRAGKGESFLKNVPLNHEILDFAAAQMRKTGGEQWTDALLGLIGLAIPEREPGRLGGAALTLLHRLDTSLPITDWTGKVFDYADLEGVDFSGRSFRRSTFRHADLTNANFENADFEECDLTGVRIEETTAVVSLSAFPSGDRLLATYSDGTARAWDIRHPRKSESRIVASQLPREHGGAVGILSEVSAWNRSQGTFTFMGFGPDGELQNEARYPVKTSYRLTSPTDTDLLVVEDGTSGSERVLVIDLEQQGVAGALKVSTVTLCAPLGQEAVVLNDASGGLRLVELNAKDGQDGESFAGGVVTCLTSLRVGERQHLIAWGEKEGTTQVWAVDLRRKECAIRKLLAHRPHEGNVTAVTFLDDTRVASGGQDRTIVISRFDERGDSPSGSIERKLQLTLLCKGMRIKGLKGPDEQRKLSDLIAKSSQPAVT